MSFVSSNIQDVHEAVNNDYNDNNNSNYVDNNNHNNYKKNNKVKETHLCLPELVES